MVMRDPHHIISSREEAKIGEKEEAEQRCMAPVRNGPDAISAHYDHHSVSYPKQDRGTHCIPYDQEPLVCGVLLVVCIVLSTRIWSTLLKKSRVRESTWGLKERALLVSGAATITLSLLLMVTVVANLQGAFAPITLTLLCG